MLGSCYNFYMIETIDFSVVKRANENGGQCFFTAGATRFFRSRYPTQAYKSGNIAFFVTSEQFESDTPRYYTIRWCNLTTGVVETYGEFNQLTRGQANYRLKKLLKLIENGVDILLDHNNERKEFYQQA